MRASFLDSSITRGAGASRTRRCSHFGSCQSGCSTGRTALLTSVNISTPRATLLINAELQAGCWEVDTAWDSVLAAGCGTRGVGLMGR